MVLADVIGQVLPVRVEDDGALTIRHDGTVASLREVTITEGLDMVSLTQVLAWDVPLDPDLRDKVAAQANTTMLGTVILVEGADGQAEVMLRYNFPSSGLDDRALQTLVLMVLDTGTRVRLALA